VAADHGMVEDHALDADQRFVADGAAMQHDQVADGDVGAERQRHAGVDMQHRAVLDVAAGADGDRVVVAAHHGVPPDAGGVAEADVADHGGVGGDPGLTSEDGLPVAEAVDGHEDFSSL
jgi:hypothetical protein